MPVQHPNAIHISPLTNDMLPKALGYLRQEPYRSALLLSNLSQLRMRCDVLVALVEDEIVGIASTYHDLPTPNLIFTATNTHVAYELVTQLGVGNPHLQSQPVMALLPESQFQQLQEVATLISYEVEFQMVVEPETLRTPTGIHVNRLTHTEVEAMNVLAKAARLTVWHPGALDLGPAFGCFENGSLVAMAATHFATPEIIEIGHVATHPDYRGRGYAKAATAAMAKAAFALAPRVFMMVLEQNTVAYATYRSIGFHPIESFYLSWFQLNAPSTP